MLADPMQDVAEAGAVGLDAPVVYRVVGAHEETADVATIEVGPDGPAIADPQPGQFTMLYAFGVGEIPVSLSGCPDGGATFRHTIRAVGPVSRALRNLTVGDPVGLRGPFGRGWPEIGGEVQGDDVVVIGGGLGIAPVRPLVLQALARRTSVGRLAVLLGARTPDELIFADEIRRWQQVADAQVAVTVDAAPPSWPGEVGVVTKLLPRLELDPARTTAMVCGPEVMLRVVARRLVDLGIDPARVFVSLERNMHCAVRRCGHCMLGPLFVCADGPVVPWSVAGPLLEVRRW